MNVPLLLQILMEIIRLLLASGLFDATGKSRFTDLVNRISTIQHQMKE